jgi:predicted methyltransferase
MRRALLSLAALTLAVPVVTLGFSQLEAKPAKGVNPELAAAVANPLRDKDRPRDQYRRPAETLAFFQVAPDMKVGEYAPGGEWYSRVLGLYLGPKGKLVGLYFDPTSGAFSEASQKGIRDGAAKYPADVAAATGLPAERFSAMTLEKIPDGEKGTFDRILIMRMLHNLNRWNIADREIKAMRDLLKPGGMVGIEQHRARPTAPYSYTDGSKGYLREKDVIAFMEMHGFSFVGRSEANANPKDPANWPDGVWTLPPALRNAKDADKPRLQAIGETDRMTLLFRKRA